MKRLLISLLVLLGVLMVGCSKDDGGTNPPPPPASPRLVVDTTVAAPSMTAVDDAVWNLVDSVNIEIGGDAANYGSDPDLGKINVTMKAITRDGKLYIYARWNDDYANLRGNYIMKTNNEQDPWAHITYAEAKGGEDKFFILFDNGDNGTEKANCATMCHGTSMTTSTDSGNVDVWNWKSTTTAPGRLAEDEWWSHDTAKSDVEPYALNLYIDNWYPYHVTGGGLRPWKMHSADTAFHGAVLYTEDAIEYKSTKEWQLGYIMPGYVIDTTVYYSSYRSANSRWDVITASRYDSISVSSTWTVVFMRNLYTGNDDDAMLSVIDSVQIAVAAADNHTTDAYQHSGSKPFYLILKP